MTEADRERRNAEQNTTPNVESDANVEISARRNRSGLAIEIKVP